MLLDHLKKMYSLLNCRTPFTTMGFSQLWWVITVASHGNYDNTGHLIVVFWHCFCISNGDYGAQSRGVANMLRKWWSPNFTLSGRTKHCFWENRHENFGHIAPSRHGSVGKLKKQSSHCWQKVSAVHNLVGVDGMMCILRNCTLLLTFPVVHPQHTEISWNFEATERSWKLK